MSSASALDARIACYRPIADYGVIGDCRSAALVSRPGSIDWLCWPRFDSPSLFGFLLDRRRGGSFHIRPVRPFRTQRRYVHETNVLETTFVTDDGSVRLLDLMPVAGEDDRCRRLRPERQILRRVECVGGRVEVDVLCDPRPDFGRVVPRLEDRGALGFCYRDGAEAVVLRSEIPLTTGGDGPGVHGRETLEEGERRHLAIVHTDGEPAVLPSFGETAERDIRMSIDWWRRWASRARYDGPLRDMVIRSALVLKLMTYAPPARSSPPRRRLCRSPSAGCETGTIAIAGSATRP